MKKCLLFLFTALSLLLVPAAMKAQTTVTIGDETSTSTYYYLPVNTFYNYSLSQQIYTADEINMPNGGTITSISFDYAYTEAFSMSGVQVYMKNVSKSTFDSITDMVEVGYEDKVFEGTFSASGAGWVTLTLNTPFHYDGTSNLLVCLYDPTSGYPGSSYKFRTTLTPSGQALALTWYSDSEIPDIEDLSSNYSGNKGTRNYRTNIKMTINPDITEINVTGFSEPAWGAHPDYTWEVPSGANYYIQTTDSKWQDLTTSSNLFAGNVFNQEGHEYALTFYFKCIYGYHFSNNVIVKINNYAYLVKNKYTDNIGYYAQTVSFTVEPDVYVGEGGVTTINAPYNSNWAYSVVEQVYTADEIGVPDGGEISAIKFKMYSSTEQTNHITVYMKHVSRSEFASTSDYEEITTSDIVYEGDYTFTQGWNTIPLAVPFNYNGTDNLMVAIHENTSGYTPRYFYGTSKTNSVLSYHSDYDDIDPYDLASWTSGKYLKSERAVIKLVIPATTVNDGSATNNYVPVYGFYADAFLKAEFVIPASSLTSVPTSRDLTSMTFYATQSNVFWGNANFKVFLKEVAGTTISDFTGYDDATIVYEGEDLYIMDGKMTVPFTTPYTYNGGNLLVGVYNTVEGTYVTSTWLGVNATGASVQGYSYSSLDEVTATQRDFLPKTTFTFTNKMEPTAQIGEGTGTNNYLPTYTLYDYSLSEQIYTGAEIGRSGDIYTLAFYNTGNVKTRDIDIYMVNTNKSSFSDSHDWTAVSSSDLVFSGEVSFLSNEWTTIELTHPFSYSSANNLLIVVDDNTGDWNGSVPFLVFDAPSQALYNYRDELDLDPSSPNYFGTVYNVKNQIRLGFEPIPCHKPTNLTVSNIGKTSATLTWEAPSDSYEWSVQYSTTPDFSTFDGELAIDRTFNLSNLTPGTTYYVRVQSSCYGIGMSEWGSTVSFTTLEACAAPTGLAISNIGNHSATISWTENDEATAWQICLDGNESSPIDVTENPYTLDGLTPNTTYSVKVRANCGGSYGVSDWSYEESFTTLEPCPAPFDLSVTGLTFNSADIEWTGFGEEYTVNYRPLSIAFSDDFENGLGQWTTVDNDGDGHNWFDISTIGSIYSYYSSLDLTSWASHGSNAALSGSYINDVGALSPDNWLITPQVSLDGMLSFRAKGTDGGYYQEHFAVYVSTTGTDPADFTQVSEEFVANYDYTNYMVDLSSFNGQQGYVAIRHFNVTDQYILAVDDFVIYDDSEPWQTTTSTSESIYLSGLTSSTDYQVMVQSNCGSDGISGWSEILTFHTPEEVTVFDGSANNSYIPVQGFYADAYLKAEYIMNASELTTMSYSDITEMTFYAQQSNISWENANFKVFMKEVPYTTLSDYTGYSDAVVVYEGPLSIVNGKMIVHFTTPYHYTGDHLLVGVYNTAIGDYHSCTWKGTNVSGASVQGYNYSSLDNVPAYQRDFVPKTTFEYVPGAVPSCLKPVDLAVNNITYSGAELSWNETGTATDWVIEYGTAIDFSGASTVNATTIPTYLLSGLTETTTYYVHVKADCGGGDESSWSYTFSFTTPEKCPTPSNLAISNIGKTSATLNWTENGTATEWQVCVNGDEAGAITVTTTPYTLTGLTTETEYTVKVRANCGGGDGVSAWSAIQTFTTLTACFAPTNLTVSNVTQTSATLEWTENDAATEWQICVNGDEANPITVTTNPYTLDGLTPNTIYSVKVRANCGGSNGVSAWSSAVSFTTISDIVISSSANWYGYATYSIDGASWNDKYISFTMQDPTTVSVATAVVPQTYAAAYANGYVWGISTSGNLIRAILDNSTQTISDFETIISGFESATAKSMSYNPIDGKMYYIEENDNLKSFDPAANLSSPTEIGTFTFIPQTLAINNTGQAYTIGYGTGDLYLVNLDDATTTLVGNTGQNCRYVQDMAFDLTTGELFWAQIASITDVGLYKVNPTTAETYFLGQIGGGSGAEITGLFMCDNAEIACLAPSHLTISHVGPTTAELSWTDNSGATEWQICLNGDEGNLITATTNPYTLTGLTPETSYSVKVRANCGGALGESYWTSPITFTTTVPCPAPEDLLVSNVSPTSAELSWTEIGEATAWQICLNGNESSPIDVTENSYTFTGLNTSETYTVKVRANCGGSDGVSDWSYEESFTTLEPCPAPLDFSVSNLTSNSADLEWTGFGEEYTVKYRPIIFSDDFENGLGQWTQIDADGDGNGWRLGSDLFTPNAHSGSDIVLSESYRNSYGALTPDNYLVTPQITLGGTVMFWVKAQDPSYPEEHFGIAVSTAGNTDATDFTTIVEWTMTAGDWQQYTVDLSAYAGQQGYVALRHFGCTDMYCLDIDDFVITSDPSSWTTVITTDASVVLDGLTPGTLYEVQVQSDCGSDGTSGWSEIFTFTTDATPPCPAPTDLIVSNTTKHTAELSWTENGTATEWQFAISSNGTDTIDILSNPWILDGLDPETEYLVKVRANCGSNVFSDWSNEVIFITEVGCQTPDNLTVVDATYSTATLNWTGEGENFTVEYEILGSGEWDTIEEILPPLTITGLQPGTDYEVHVMGNCDADGMSLWSNIVEFSTPLCPIPINLEVSNTTKHTADLNWMEIGTATEWQINLSDGIDNVIIPVTDIPSYTLTGLDAYTEYTVMVQSNCEGAWSGWGDMVIFITELGCLPTTDLAATDATNSSVMLTWTGEGETFHLQYRPASGDWETIDNVTSPYVLDGLLSGTDYEVQVMNDCGADGVSDWSNSVTFTTLLCPIPTDIEVTNVGKHTATVSWTENGSATEWQILVTSDVFDTLTVTENPYTLIDLAAETEYTVKVRANCSGAWSDWSDMTIFTTPIGCQATSDLAWTAVSQSSATLTWTGEGETFILQYKADGEEWATIDDVTSPYTLTGLQSNTEYMVQVMNNCNADGVSAWSNMVTFTTSLCPTPSNLSATNVDKHTATLGWTETGEATEWQIMLVSSDTNIIDVTVNPYTLNELADGTEYTAKARANCGGTWSNWSEQVTFTTLIGCPATDNLAVTAFTQTTATLEWTGEGATFNMQYRTPGGEWTTINSVTSPYILSGLTPSTSYEAQIQNDCGLEGTSEWSNLATFTTSACDPQAIPYAYDFEAEDPFYCWSVVTGNVQRLHALPSQNHTTDGEYSLAFNESASDVIAFPQFTQEVNTLQVSFWVRPHNNTMSGNGTFAVGYLTDVNDASTFTAVSTYSYDEWPGTYEFMRKIVTLQDAPAGATIAFRHDSPTADGSWYVDDILVSAICNVPTGITVTNITNNSATVTWTDNGAGSWDVTRTNLENFAHNVTTNEYTFTELNPGTEYFIKVRSRCGDDIISNWSEVVSFTTLTNSIPTYVDITGDSIVCHLSTTLLTANTDVPATYLWSNGATTQQINVGAGTYQVTVTSATGDELASEPFVLTEIPSFATQESRSICPNELPYIWNGHTFTETGMEHVTLTAANGCDSIVTMILTVNPTYNDTIEVSTCEGEGYIFNGEYLYESGYYVDSLQTINGCDSVVVLSLTVNPIYAIKAVETICSSELPYEWNGVTFNEEGTQVAQFETVNGCDSLIVMTLYVNPSYSDTIVANICAGDAYNFYGQLLTSSGEYTHPMQTVDGCDSVEVLALTVNPTHSVTEERTVCSIALPYTWNGVLFTGPATKYATLHTASGCDSVVTMVLSVSNAFEITETRAVCASELPIVWNGKTFNEAGTQMDTLTASNGCDSIVTMVLTVNTPVNTVTTTESCGAFTWAANGETYTESDTYLYEHLDAHGCTQVDTLYLTIYNPVNTATTAESCGSYTWEANGQTYTESDTYLYEHLDVHGCTQVDTLYLTIYNPVNTASSVTACGAFTWAANGETYTESDTYLYEHLDAHGCTQVDTLYLTIYNPMNTATTAESCGAYTWEANGQTYTESNTYYYEHQDAHGCTQVDTLYLTINTPTNTAITEAACGSYTWAANGQTYTESGTYYYEHQDAHNCTQVDTLYLTINTPVNTATTAESCGSYTWAANGQTYTESNTYYYEHQDANGCTQVDTLYLTINNPVNTVTTDESCGSYTWAANGQTYYVSGEYTYSHQDANGCTQVDTLRLTILQGSSAVLTNIICASELPYEWNGVTFTEAGMQTTTIEAANGCDSVITMVLMVNTPVHHAYTAEACGSYTWVNGNNQTYTTSGDYTYSHQDINGCTQVDTLHLTIFTPAHNSITVAECGSYTWTGGTGVTYTESGDYLYSHQDANGCTQVDTLHLTIFTPIHTAITVAECGSYTWTGGNGVTYTESGNYTYSHQDAHGCTQVDTLHLTIYNPVHTAITAESCGSYTWEANNQTYAVSGDYTYSHQDNHGCTQVDTLHLTILQGSSAVLMNTICASELPYEWNGVTFTEAGMQTATITAANGCDSVVTMVLTINTPVHTAISASECGSYTWTANGQTYTASGDYTYSHLDANGCTQVDTLHLTIYNPVHTAVTVSECGDYTWNGQTYTASGDYTYSHLDVHGCTQVDTLHLTIHNPVHTAVTVSECSSYTWNGQTYTTSGDYTYSHLDANGCTQVDTLHLTIFTPAHSAITVTECGDYTWNGQTYTASGDYTYSHIDANGCTQVDTLHLTIHNPVHTAITVEECDSYTWTDGNNQNYTTSGTYTYEHQDANGCTQVDTLHLTIHQSATSEFTIATQDSCYTWNGQTYCASGDYVQTLETAFGCDSVVTLHLTTSVGVTVHEMETVFLAPNPTKNISRIMGLETDPVSVDLYDMRGKLVMKASGRELDVTTLPTGLYMVKIYTGDRFINLKLVKQ